MSFRFSAHKDGFTLVELSIVLVIIGLLIGGILAAQSMISSAKLVSQVGQFQQFDAGVNAFYVKYNALPGDSKFFGGDEDGIIDQSDIGGGHDNQINTFACDIANFWNGVDSTQFPGSESQVNGVGNNCSTYGIAPVLKGAAKNVPTAKLGVSNSFVIASAMGAGSYYADTVAPANYYAIINPQINYLCCPSYNAFYTTTLTNSSLTPVDMLALDKKMDDGIGNNGNVLSGSISNIGGGGAGGVDKNAVSACSDNSTGKYNLATKTNACTPLVRIGAQTGNVK
jgi:prepilin-type N-terminal cleavage/methylation domain-containing protein